MVSDPLTARIEMELAEVAPSAIADEDSRRRLLEKAAADVRDRFADLVGQGMYAESALEQAVSEVVATIAAAPN